MKSIIYFALILFCSCNMGKQYANYRAGGNSNKKEHQIMGSDCSETKEEKENKLEEITYLDTLTIKKIPGNKIRFQRRHHRPRHGNHCTLLRKISPEMGKKSDGKNGRIVVRDGNLRFHV